MWWYNLIYFNRNEYYLLISMVLFSMLMLVHVTLWRNYLSHSHSLSQGHQVVYCLLFLDLADHDWQFSLTLLFPFILINYLCPLRLRAFITFFANDVFGIWFHHSNSDLPFYWYFQEDQDCPLIYFINKTLKINWIL